MRLPALFAAPVLLFALSTPAPAAPAPSPGHPIVGIWRLSLPELSCTETYRFRADGTTLVTSAAEVSESRFSIPERPSAKGFYRLEDKIVKDNGKKDCSGEVMAVGKSVTNFVRFHPSGALFVMCADESMAMCIGPFERVTGEEA